MKVEFNEIRCIRQNFEIFDLRYSINYPKNLILVQFLEIRKREV